MSNNVYTPDRWVLIDTGDTLKVFGTWYGGYTTGDSWQLSSGIKEIIETAEQWVMPQYSGSTYKLNKDYIGTSMYTEGVLQGFMQQVPSFKRVTIEETFKLLESGTR